MTYAAFDPPGDPLSGLASHRPYLMRVAMIRVRDPQRAEDVVQETLLAALRATAGFAGRSAYRTWLTGILLHKIHDDHRRRAREDSQVCLDEAFGNGTDDELFDEAGAWRSPPADWGGPERALENKQFLAAFARGVEALPPRQAEAFLLREVTGLASEEICARLGVTPANLWVLLHRARNGLRAALGREWFAPAASGPSAAP